MWRRVRLILKVLLLILMVVAVAGTGYGVLTVRSSFPQVSGTVTVPGLRANVEVRRDAWGIPQITAESDEDLFMAQGYVHAQDRFWEMDFRRHVTAGRLSELFGASQVETDAFIRTLGWRRVAEQELPLLSPDTIRYLEAYTAGVNAYLEQRSGAALSLEYAVLGLQNPGYAPEPWMPADSVAWLKAMAWDLRGNMNEEILRVQLASRLSDAQIADVFPDYPYDRHPVIVTTSGEEGGTARASASLPAGALDLAAVAARLAPIAKLADRLPVLLGRSDRSGIGSNSFAVAGSRTVSGKPLLANDTHLAPTMPGIWHQVGLHCRVKSADCRFDVSGFSFSGVPGVVIGHNDRVAWGLTNLAPDVTDLFLEDVQGDRYRSGQRMVELDVRTETISVAGGDPVTIRVRSTAHGPLLSDVADFYAYIGSVAPALGETPGPQAAPDIALRWTALDPGRTMDALFLIDAAADFDDFRAAARYFEVPSQNMLYAGVDGHIGYQAPGRVPVRATGDGKWPVPGWDPAYDWGDDIPFEAMPWILDPAGGYIVTANNAVTPRDHPSFLTDDWTLGYRAARIVELVEAAGPLDVAGMSAIDFDQHGPLADLLAPALVERVAGSDQPDAVLAAAALFDGWDGQQTADSAPAAFLNAVWRNLLRITFDDELASTGVLAGGDERWIELLRRILNDRTDAWWDDVSTEDVVEKRDEMLDRAMLDATNELRPLLGNDPAGWRWGRLHTLRLVNQTFGKSGIGPIEWLFNRGPYELGGGRDAVDATAWTAPAGYGVDWLPSMRMVVDLSDLDASTYISLTGVSGHAFGPHYDDQTPLWVRGESIAWPFSSAAIEASTDDVLILTTGVYAYDVGGALGPAVAAVQAYREVTGLPPRAS